MHKKVKHVPFWWYKPKLGEMTDSKAVTGFLTEAKLLVAAVI